MKNAGFAGRGTALLFSVTLALMVFLCGCGGEAGEAEAGTAAARSAPAASMPSALPYVWLEAEQPTSENFETNRNGWGNAQYLSEDNWLHFAIQANEAEQKVPEGGLLIGYDFQVDSAGQYEVWGRLGHEMVRAPFEWRIDQGEWDTIDPREDLSVDLMEIARWVEVAWVEMGKLDLAAGKHTLQTRHTVRYQGEGDNKKAQRIIYEADVFCLYKGEFRPNSRHKPDADWQTDRDRAAAEHVFRMPAKAAAGGRTELDLAGDWQIARYDEEGLVEDRTGPIKSVPGADKLYWSAISVPGDRDAQRHDLVFAHRCLYRARVNVPAEFEGQSFFLDFTEINMLATVFVNGKQCAFHDAPLTGFIADVTDAVRPGEVNEIWVGIKDAYYAISPIRNVSNARFGFNYPLGDMSTSQGMTMDYDYPMKGHTRNGITDGVKLVATGQAYTEDVFAIPSVKKKELALEVTVKNPTGQDIALTVENEVVPLDGGPAEKTFAVKQLTVPAGRTAQVDLAEAWAEPHLWWPDDPFQYNVVTRLRAGGQVLDTTATKFGFREWGIDGTRFVLNGVPWQLRANLDYYSAREGQAEEAAEWWRQSGQNMFRLRFQAEWAGMSQNGALDFFDAHGVPVRRTCSTFDGQHASYTLATTVEKDGERVRVPHTALFEHWRKQVAARVRQQRNHPSVFLWELDNEIIYINTRNFGNLGPVEPEFKKAAEMILAMDPSGRGVSVAGGRALMDQSLPVNGCHYEASATRDYPDMAYGLGSWTDQDRGQVWPMALDRPIFLSEEYYANGWQPGKFSIVGGEKCFLGRAETNDACGLVAKMYSEGYRWQALGGFHYWFGRYGTAHYSSWQPVLALCREWNWTFGGGETVRRTLMVRNDTRYDDPIEMQWELQVGGKRVAGERKTYSIPPGEGEVVEVSFGVPRVGERTAAQFILTCYRGGKEIWSEAKEAWVIDADAAPKPRVGAGDVVVWDPQGSAAARLKQRGIAFKAVAGPEELPEDFRLLVIGRDALSAREATEQRWYALAAQGKRVLVLDQANPLHYQAVPANFTVTDYVGRVAFSENLKHPVFDGLDQADFFCWSGDHVVYRNAYEKATSGARSLAQCDEFLSCSAVAECTVNEGLMLLCQMVVGEKLADEPTAKRLFDNMVNYALDYRLVRNTTAAVMPAGDPRGKLLADSGLQYTEADDALAAVRGGDERLIIVDGRKETLDKLSANLDDVQQFTEGGGWLMLWGVTPDGLASFNRIVGYDHVMRPFRQEKVTLAAVRDPLISGMSQRDVVLYSGERIFGWMSDEYAADDVFTHVVDLDDIAPFATGPGVGGTASVTNGFTSTDAWKYILYTPMHEDGSVPVLNYELPRRETVIGFSIIPNNHYWLVTKIKLVFDGDESKAQVIELADYDKENNPRQDFELAPVEAGTITCVPLEWKEMSERAILGVDNLWIRVERPDDFHERVVPLLNIGALVKYPRGEGGIILNQLKVQERETVPVNADKKAAVFSTVMRNLNAVFAGRKVLLPGAGLTYHPISLEGRCNLYLTAERGWPDKERDFSHLPLDRQRFSGVLYEIRDFKTSPLENAIALKGMWGLPTAPEEVTGLAVGRTADALFFLHTFHRKAVWNPRRETDEPPTIFQYVVHYADGKTETVDVKYGRGAEYWRSESPTGLADATIAWTAPFPGDPANYAVLYQFQWNNPHPETTIESIDLRYDDEVGGRYGAPILLGVTAAEVIE